MKHIILAIAFTMLMIPAATTRSQDSVAVEKLIQTVAKLATVDVHLTGGIVEEDVKKEAGIADGIQKVVLSNVFGGGKEFSGDFDLLVTRDSEIALVSKDEFPGIKLWKSGEKLLCIQTHDETPFQIASLPNLVGATVQWKSIVEAVKKSSKTRVSTKNGDTTIRVTLDTSLVPTKSPENEIGKQLGGQGVRIQAINATTFRSEIVDITGTFVLGPDNELKSVEYSIQYNDPMKAAMKGGAIRIQGNVPKPSNDELELGKLITISYEPSKSQSDKVRQFAKQAQELSKAK